MLPDDLREKLQPLQRSILTTTEGLRSRLSDRTKVTGIGPSPRRETALDDGEPPLAVRGGGYGFTAGADVKNIQEIGTKLFDCLFQQDVYALYRESLAKSQRISGANLPIKLLVEPPELAYVPWETLFDKRGNFHLCLFGATPFARAA